MGKRESQVRVKVRVGVSVVVRVKATVRLAAHLHCGQNLRVDAADVPLSDVDNGQFLQAQLLRHAVHRRQDLNGPFSGVQRVRVVARKT